MSILLLPACEEPVAPPAQGGIVSLSPALTSIVLGLGGEDALVAVSNYDTDPRVADLPRAGDYLNVDWEKLAELRPGLMLVQQRDENLEKRAREMGIRANEFPINSFHDIELAVFVVANNISSHGVEDARVAANRWDSSLSWMREETSASVRVLLVCGDRSLCAAGGTYLDEMLTLAGGKNVLTGEGYLEPDDEQVAALAPEVILVLLPEGDADAVRARWERFGRVEIIERADALVPGWNVVEIAEAMRDALAPEKRGHSYFSSGTSDQILSNWAKNRNVPFSRVQR